MMTVFEGRLTECSNATTHGYRLKCLNKTFELLPVSISQKKLENLVGKYVVVKGNIRHDSNRIVAKKIQPFPIDYFPEYQFATDESEDRLKYILNKDGTFQLSQEDSFDFAS